MATTMKKEAADDHAEEAVILLDFWASMFGMRVRIALHEKSIPFHYQEEDLREKSQLLLSSNPIHKKIPVLIHNNKPLCESLLIVQYIDEAFPSSESVNNNLLPSDPYARAQARFWADYIDKKLYDAGSRIWRNKAGSEEREQAKREFLETLKNLEEKALNVNGGGEYFGGESFGYLDIALIPFACWFEVYEVHGGFKVEEECVGIGGWVKRCMERESVKKSLQDPKKICEFVGMLKKVYGIED